MTARPIVVYDANVLYPAQLRDLLMRLAVSGLVRAHWSDQIHEEWMGNVLVNRPDLRQEQLDRTRALMERALPSARVEGYEQHMASISLPDPDDRHVVAAAIEAKAEVIVTFNLRDFPESVFDPLGLKALHPDAFVLSLFEAHPDHVAQREDTQCGVIGRRRLSGEGRIGLVQQAADLLVVLVRLRGFLK